MAEAILSPLLDLIFGNLASAAMQVLQLVWGVEEDLQNLKSTLSAIQALLEDAEERQFQSKAIQDWLQKLQEVGYDADDLVDEIGAGAQQLKTEGSGTGAGKKKKKQQVLTIAFSCFNCSPIRYWLELAIRVRELEKIAKERRDLHLEPRDGSKQLEIIREQRPPASPVTDESAEVFGRLDDMGQIIRSLLSDDSGKRNFSVIAIAGMGGMSKITIAQLVYNDKRVTENFKLRAWVCLSEAFDVLRPTKEIISSAIKRTCDLLDINTVQCSLWDKLNGKKLLLVLDDVWSGYDSDWE